MGCGVNNFIDPCRDLCFNKLDKMAIQVGIGLSTAKDLIQATKEAVNQASTNIHADKIDLAVVFSSIEFAHTGVLKTIGSLLGSVPIIDRGRIKGLVHIHVGLFVFMTGVAVIRGRSVDRRWL